MQCVFKRVILAILALSYVAPVQTMSLGPWIKNGFFSLKTSISNTSTKTKIFAGLGAAAATATAAYFLYKKYWNNRTQAAVEPPANQPATQEQAPVTQLAPAIDLHNNQNPNANIAYNNDANMHQGNANRIPTSSAGIIIVPAPKPISIAQPIVAEPHHGFIFSNDFSDRSVVSAIFVQDRFNSAIQSTITATNTETIKSIKEKLRTEQSIPSTTRIKLLFRNQELSDQKKLADYKIQHEDTLSFILQAPEAIDHNKLYITTLSGTTYTINIDSAKEHIADIQEKIEKATNIPENRQYLIYNKQILDPTKTLAQCGISYGSRLYLIRNQYDERNMNRTQIFIKKLNGNTITIDCYPHTTIRRIKNIIMTKEGIPCDHQRIVWGGRELDDHRTVEDYNLHRENASHLVVRTPKIVQEEKEKKEAARDEKTLQEQTQTKK